MGSEGRKTGRPRLSILLPQHGAGEADVGDTAERIVRALYEDPTMREVLTPRPDPDAPPYATLSESMAGPPAEDVPFLIPEIGVLSVPAPAGGAQAVEELIRDVAPGALVQEVGTYSATDGGEQTTEDS